MWTASLDLNYGIFASQAFVIVDSLPQTLGLRLLDLSGLTAPSIGYKIVGQKQATNEMTVSIIYMYVLASISLVTHCVAHC